jgi:hypothetical protein
MIQAFVHSGTKILFPIAEDSKWIDFGNACASAGIALLTGLLFIVSAAAAMPLEVNFASAEFFRTMGVAPQLGCAFAHPEEQPGSADCEAIL